MTLIEATKKIMDGEIKLLQEKYPGLKYSVHEYYEQKEPAVEVWSTCNPPGMSWGFKITGFPENHRAAVLHGVFVNPKNIGLGQELLLCRLEILREAGYTLAMATTRVDNMVENHILFKHGFATKAVINNPKDWNDNCYLWVREIR